MVSASVLGRLDHRGGFDTDDLLAPTLALEDHVTVHQGEERIVPPASDVQPGMDLRPALAYDDRPCLTSSPP